MGNAEVLCQWSNRHPCLASTSYLGLAMWGGTWEGIAPGVCAVAPCGPAAHAVLSQPSQPVHNLAAIEADAAVLRWCEHFRKHLCERLTLEIHVRSRVAHRSDLRDRATG